ncbi:MAG: hypothetical protein KAT12_07045 [Gammaproteobacteria bacterium]|nr:hypothetical protein [Gammaproteobacteria bacterium]
MDKKAETGMSKELIELRDAVGSFALEHSISQIPQTYFDKMIKTWHDMNLSGHDWDKYKAAAALLYAAVIDGLIHQSQVTPQGYRALDWAENFLQQFDQATA